MFLRRLGQTTPRSPRLGWGRRLTVWLAGSILALAAGLVWAEPSVTLAWDPSSGPNVGGYNLYYGEVGGGTTNKLFAGTNNFGTIKGLLAGKTYFVYVTAFASPDLESGPSNTVHYSPPDSSGPTDPGTSDPGTSDPGTSVPGNTAPALSGLEDVVTDWDNPLTVRFYVRDQESPANQLQIAVVSSNEGLVRVAGLGSDLSGEERSFALTPVSGQSGNATIRVRVADPDGGSASSSFTLAVTAPGEALTLTVNTNLTTAMNTPTAVEPIRLSAPANVVEQVSLSATSLTPDLLPEEGIFFGGAGAERYLVIMPAPNQHGVGEIVLSATVGNQVITRHIWVNVLADAVPPTISGLPLQVQLAPGRGATLAFQVGASGNEEVLVRVETSSGEPANSIYADGTGPNRTLRLDALPSGTTGFWLTVKAQSTSGLASEHLIWITVAKPFLKIERAADGVALVWPDVDGVHLEGRFAMDGWWEVLAPEITRFDGVCRALLPLGKVSQFFRIVFDETNDAAKK